MHSRGSSGGGGAVEDHLRGVGSNPGDARAGRCDERRRWGSLGGGGSNADVGRGAYVRPTQPSLVSLCAETGDDESLSIPSEAAKEIKQAKGTVFKMSDEPMWWVGVWRCGASACRLVVPRGGRPLGLGKAGSVEQPPAGRRNVVRHWPEAPAQEGATATPPPPAVSDAASKAVCTLRPGALRACTANLCPATLHCDPAPCDPVQRDLVPCDSVPQDPAPRDLVLHDPVPRDLVPHDPVPRDLVPHDPVPHDPIPGHYAREHITDLCALAPVRMSVSILPPWFPGTRAGPGPILAHSQRLARSPSPPPTHAARCVISRRRTRRLHVAAFPPPPPPGL
eukprot:312280-Chlamydomonas_euryale.AAC.2